MPSEPVEPVPVALAPLPVDNDDFRLRHKTSDRQFYDDVRRETGCFEVLFYDAEGFLTEGSFTHLFVEQGGQMVTPPLMRGMLPGILRARMIEAGDATEADVALASLPSEFYIGNSLRGLIRARRAH